MSYLSGKSKSADGKKFNDMESEGLVYGDDKALNSESTISENNHMIKKSLLDVLGLNIIEENTEY